VKHAWLIDSASRTLEIYALERGRWSAPVMHRNDAVIRAEPFDAIEIDFAELWSI
jgi:hypothetical protein